MTADFAGSTARYYAIYRRDFRSREPNLAGRLFRRYATAGVELLLDDLDRLSRGRWPADPP